MTNYSSTASRGRAGGGRVSSLDRYAYLEAVLAKDRPEFGLRDDGRAKGGLEQLQVMQRIVKTHPGPIPADVQTALFLATRDKKREAAYFAGLSATTVCWMQLVGFHITTIVLWYYVVCPIWRFTAGGAWERSGAEDALSAHFYSAGALFSSAAGWLWGCLVVVLRPIVCPLVWLCLFPVKLMVYALALIVGPLALIVEHVSGYKDKSYEAYWTENPFFCFWPFFCLFSGAWPTVIAEALILALYVYHHPWYVNLKNVLGGAAAAAVALSAFAAMVVLDMNNPSLCRPRRWSYA